MENLWRDCGGSVEGLWRDCGGTVEALWRDCGGTVEGLWRRNVCGGPFFDPLLNAQPYRRGSIDSPQNDVSCQIVVRMPIALATNPIGILMQKSRAPPRFGPLLNAQPYRSPSIEPSRNGKLKPAPGPDRFLY